jgi:hypothetical protein
MVVIFLPIALDTGVMQDRIGRPSRWTVHAPHSATPQPNFVPRQADDVAQHPKERHVIRNLEFLLLTVDSQSRHWVAIGHITDQFDTKINDGSMSVCWP